VRERDKQPEKKTTVLYTPFLEMTPAEPDAMKTAVVHAQHITTLTGQEWTVFSLPVTKNYTKLWSTFFGISHFSSPNSAQNHMTYHCCW